MISTATQPGGTKPNEDWVGTTDKVVVVLDGLSAPEGVSGCVHGTPWYVERLGEQLLARAASDIPLREALRQSILEVSRQHPECDLSDPGTPSSTVAIVRVCEEQVEALVLADSPVLVDTTAGPEILTDRRVDTVVQHEQAAALRAPTGSTEKLERMATLVRAQRSVRNTEDGYWIAGSMPEAADHALEQSWCRRDVQRFAAMTDGVSCLVELYGANSWLDLLDLAECENGEAVIDCVRAVEASDPEGVRWPRYKTSDDASIAFYRLAP